MATGRNEEAAEKAYMYAENRFLANDIAGALRAAGDARRLFRDLPGLDNAVVAYEVHAAAASRANLNGGGRNQYAVLAVGDDHQSVTSSVTHESLKKQYRRLCLVLHPDKNRSAAAEGAFKLLREAWGELSLLYPPAAATAGEAPDWKPRQARPRRRRTIYCPHCGCSFVTVVNDDVSGVNCLDCNNWVSMPSQSSTAGPAPPPPPPRQRETPSPSPPSKSKFQCPGHCTRCGAKFTTKVSIGTCLVRCGACNTCAMVSVKSPTVASTWIL